MPPLDLRFVLDDLRGAAIARFLDEHLQDMRSVSPPDSKHALDLEGLRRPKVAFYSAWRGPGELVGCGALLALDPTHAELKSMRVAPAMRRTGVASALLIFLLEEAQQRGFRRISLETGSQPFFFPAHRLYTKFGFTPCGPFGPHQPAPLSLFFTRAL